MNSIFTIYSSNSF